MLLQYAIIKSIKGLMKLIIKNHSIKIVLNLQSNYSNQNLLKKQLSILKFQIQILRRLMNSILII